MADKLRLEIVTPEERTYSEEVDYVELPGLTGDMGVYPHHVPLLSEIVPGELKVTNNGQEFLLAVGTGVVEITGRSVSVLTDMAVKEADIDEAAVEAAIKRAQAAMAEKLSAEESASVQAALLKSLAQLKVKRRRRS
jgi:F-type H+-transporting ATPase subunit epsilon